MSAGARSALWFCLRFLPLFAALLWLYPRVLPAYERLVIGAANRCLAFRSPPLHLTPHPHGYIAGTVLHPGSGPEPVAGLTGFEPLGVFAQLPLVAALLLATPMKPRSLVKRTAAAMLLVFAVHTFATVAVFHAWLAAQSGPHSAFYDWLGLVALTSGPVAAFVVWGLLTWDFWLPLVRRGARSEESGA